MAEHIYLGPVSFKLRGNREDAQTLEREARAKIGYLFDSMLPGQTFKAGTWDLGGGYKIKAFVWDDSNGKRVVTRLTAPSKGGGESVFWMHHGFYGTNEQTSTRRVYVPKDIEDYFLGTEDGTPKGFTGVLEYDGSSYNTGSVPFPELDDEKSYDPEESLLALGMPVPEIFLAHDSSGLGVAFWQAKNGAGDHGSPAGTFPDWSLATRRVTLVRSPQDAYWLVRWQQTSGITLARMLIHEDLIPLYGMLRNMENGIEKRIAFSFVLGYLRWDGSDPIVVLDSEVTDTIFTKNSLEPFGWEWQWTWQEFDAIDEFEAKAVFTVWRQLDCFTHAEGTCDFFNDAVSKSRKCLLTLNWNDGAPVDASLEITESDAWKLHGPDYYTSLLRVQYTDRSYAYCWGWGAELGDWNERYDSCPGNENENSAVLCSWYKKDGSLLDIVWGPWQTYSSPSTYSTGSLSIGDDTYSLVDYNGAALGVGTRKFGTLVFGRTPRSVWLYFNEHFIHPIEETDYVYPGNGLKATTIIYRDDLKIETELEYYDWSDSGYNFYMVGPCFLTQVFYAVPGEMRVGFTSIQSNNSANDNMVYATAAESFIWGDSYSELCLRTGNDYYWDLLPTIAYTENVTEAEGLKYTNGFNDWAYSWCGAA